MKTKLPVSSALCLLAFACGTVFLLGLAAPPARAQAPNWRKALQFDGANDFVVFNGAPLLPPWTAEMWVCRQDAPYSSAVLLNDASTALKLEQTNQSRRVGFSTNGGDYVFDYIAPSNTWVHLAFVCDTSTRLYVNGVLQGTDPHTIPLPLQQLGALTNRLGQTNVALKAIVDDLRVWRVARSQAEISGNLGHPLTGQESGLFSYWKFDETSGLRAWDATTNRLHGTLMNRPRHVPSRSTVEIALQGPACMTNGLHVRFNDPGAVNVATACPLEVAGAWEQAYALQADSTVVHWGADTYSAIILAAATNVVGLAVQSPAQFSFVVRDNATIIGWGPSAYGVTNPPVRASNVVEVACGSGHALALRADGTVVGWGDNSKGQTNPPVRATNVVQIAAGLYHSLALRADGTIVGWGDNSKGATNAPARATNVVQIATSFEHNVALRADGTVVAWGYNSDGQTNVPANVTNVVAVGAGYNYCMALKADGTVRVWGDTNIVYGTTNSYGLTNIPANATNVVAISAGTVQAWVLKADGTIIGWGDTNYDAVAIPSGLNNIRPNSVGVSGTVDLNTLGTNVLTYWTTNLFGQVGTATRTVVVVPVGPIPNTQPATAITATGATLHGTVNPQNAPATAWFEYGLTTQYGSTTPGTNMGADLITRDMAASITGLLPWMTYHFRAVATNVDGAARGPDQTFTLAGPASTLPALSGLTDLTIPQGSSRVTIFSVFPGDLEVSVRCDNTVLFPAGSLTLGGAANSRLLNLAPDSHHSGSARVTVTASDGTHTTNATFTVTVTPQYSSAFLRLTNVQAVTTQSWRFRLTEFGTASTNYVVEYRRGLAPTNSWITATNVTDLGGGLYQVASGTPTNGSGFYRVKGLRGLAASLSAANQTTDEGTFTGPVLVFNGLYSGTVHYTWNGTNTGTLRLTNVTTAVIPSAGSSWSDDTGVSQLQYLTLRLDAGTNYGLGSILTQTIGVEENDADWQGILQTDSGSLNFVLRLARDANGLQGWLRSDQAGFFPTNTPGAPVAQLAFTTSAFTAVVTNIPLPAQAGSPLFSVSNRVTLRLVASGATNVSPTKISGDALLVSTVPGQPSLDSAQSGTFVLQKPPTLPSTNQVRLY